MLKKTNRLRHAPLRAWLAALSLALVPACGSHPKATGEEADESIQECDAFLASYQHCLETLGPVETARARVAQTRTGFDATHGHAARTALRKSCADNLSRLKTTCR
jgi:hypothetical protein